MKVLRNSNVLIKAINNFSDLGFVPTMGGLHNGHISLIKESQKICKKTIVSIFVNPKQFTNKTDFAIYPRDIKRDLIKLEKLKVDYLFIPSTIDIYNFKRERKITLLKSQKILCAKYRKGHFEGVLDVMDRFIKLIKPKYVFMGKKDYQQLFLVRNFIKKKYRSKIYACSTVRDKNNIALSSRNFLLSKKNYIKAGLIANFLMKFKCSIKINNQTKNYLQIIKKELCVNFQIKIDYLDIRNEKDLKEKIVNNNYRIFIAYYLGKVRLIDNF